MVNEEISEAKLKKKPQVKEKTLTCNLLKSETQKNSLEGSKQKYCFKKLHRLN